FPFRCLLAGRFVRPAIRLNRHHITLLHDMIIGPKQMGCHAAPRPPGLGDLGERLGVRTFAQTKSKACGFLHGEVAGRKGIRLPTAVRSIRPLATALPISRIDLIFGAESPSRLSLSARARRTVSW